MKIKVWVPLVITLLMVCLSSYGFCSGTDKFKRSDFPAVLMYHDIKETEINGFDVSVKDFCQQLDWLAAHEYKTLSVHEFVECLTQNIPFPKKSVLITFDDGYDGINTYAVPELRKRGMKATFFIIKNSMGTKLTGYSYLTEQQIKELSVDPLFSIQPHTLTHADLSKISAEQLQEEVAGSKKFFEDLTGTQSETIAFPYGSYNKSVLDAVERAGYKASFAVSDLGLYDHEARFSIPRIYMGIIMGKNNMELFKKSVLNYKSSPKEAFVERFGPLY
ncbi:Poly-beta-1,6-N-acetyl-D-glucosamine N-deacetylase precursor [Sporomusa ovata DSM 2662]|uniref:Polysaccharide deacetylase n=1 Tax=Sporomusa ovata TaxID=2378 RepID=A0A0U1L6J6_9FIRM|nr:polysaccharide deacetylase family protein [Sporomusa ovata]EQB28568.1 putative xylanase/chitin deacetylase [Sporomusa ovata DSM 2662]CQR74899.1 Polysaccharide deacetylase [Sporomusa ovata]